MEVYIYINLIRVFKDQLNASSVIISLYIMLGSIAVFHATVLVDLFLAMSGGNMTDTLLKPIVEVSLFIAIASLVIYSLAGLVLSILLLMRAKESSKLLKYFSVLLLIVCLLQLTVFLAIVNIVLFPLALAILAAYFLKEPDTVEVV